MKMSRRFFIVFAVLVVVLAAKAHNQAQAATDRLDVKTIKYALKVSEEENQGFIERVVFLMEKGRLTRASVTVAFLKARQRVKNKFQYFKYAMIHLAKRQNVELK